ncbi:MAG: hypothetical protein O4859_14465 [Trichodesmium sp. St18_bin1]|nr:hypothetical protein [Trichodesmium sp. St18_bin1]
MANSYGRKFLPSDLWTQKRSLKLVILGAPSLGTDTYIKFGSE